MMSKIDRTARDVRADDTNKSRSAVPNLRMLAPREVSGYNCSGRFAPVPEPGAEGEGGEQGLDPPNGSPPSTISST
jgi:hypothetical protein